MWLCAVPLAHCIVEIGECIYKCHVLPRCFTDEVMLHVSRCVFEVRSRCFIFSLEQKRHEPTEQKAITQHKCSVGLTQMLHSYFSKSHSKMWHQKPMLWPLGRKKWHKSSTCTCITQLHSTVYWAHHLRCATFPGPAPTCKILMPQIYRRSRPEGRTVHQ